MNGRFQHDAASTSALWLAVADSAIRRLALGVCILVLEEKCDGQVVFVDATGLAGDF